MWLCGSQYFLSVVADRQDKARLLVRARVAGHIQAVFPDAEVFTNDDADYFYRAYIQREQVGLAVANELQKIGYDNFKSSVANHALHQAYLGVWTVMRKLQGNSHKSS